MTSGMVRLITTLCSDPPKKNVWVFFPLFLYEVYKTVIVLYCRSQVFSQIKKIYKHIFRCQTRSFKTASQSQIQLKKKNGLINQRSVRSCHIQHLQLYSLCLLLLSAAHRRSLPNVWKSFRRLYYLSDACRQSSRTPLRYLHSGQLERRRKKQRACD